MLDDERIMFCRKVVAWADRCRLQSAIAYSILHTTLFYPFYLFLVFPLLRDRSKYELGYWMVCDLNFPKTNTSHEIYKAFP